MKATVPLKNEKLGCNLNCTTSLYYLRTRFHGCGLLPLATEMLYPRPFGFYNRLLVSQSAIILLLSIWPIKNKGSSALQVRQLEEARDIHVTWTLILETANLVS